MKLIINECIYNLHRYINKIFHLLKSYFSLLIIFSDKTPKIALGSQDLFWVPRPCNETEANIAHKVLEEFCNSIVPSGITEAGNTISQASPQKSKTFIHSITIDTVIYFIIFQFYGLFIIL